MPDDCVLVVVTLLDLVRHSDHRTPGQGNNRNNTWGLVNSNRLQTRQPLISHTTTNILANETASFKATLWPELVKPSGGATPPQVT